MTRFLRSLALFLLLAPAARAETDEELRAELQERVARNNWAGADRAYVALADQSKPTPTDHRLGGQAARAMGHVNDAADRLEKAAKTDEEAAAILAEIERRFGEVKLKVTGEGGVPLRAKAPLIDSEYRLVVEAAKKQLEASGSYNGLLPLGGFTLGDQEFTVTADKPAKATLKR